MRLDYTALGDLKYLVVETPLGKQATFTFEDDRVKLASSPDGKQLYCIGGDQNILPLLDERSREKDFIDLGDAPSCSFCGSIMTRNGSCYRCGSCGSTSGCS